MPDEMAMFPLGRVLFPGEALPLHVFEPRYRELVRHCLAEDVGFGVALIERGSEVGGGDVRFDIGCEARILESAMFDDGRYALIAAGTRRIEVTRWLDDDPYPRAEVVDRPDPAPSATAADHLARLVAPLERVLTMAAALGEAAPPDGLELVDDPRAASHQLASLAPVGPLDRLALLAAPSVDERLALLEQFLDDAAVVLASRLGGI